MTVHEISEILGQKAGADSILGIDEECSPSAIVIEPNTLLSICEVL